jgi:ribosomal protein S18 acetylase RimI-like enzyme
LFTSRGYRDVRHYYTTAIALTEEPRAMRIQVDVARDEGARAFYDALEEGDGGKLAAIARTEANRFGGGYVATLGVRPAYRGRGYGRALLQHSFREFWRRGLRRVALDVHTENPTNALQVYKSVGMQVEMENVNYEKELT